VIPGKRKEAKSTLPPKSRSAALPAPVSKEDTGLDPPKKPKEDAKLYTSTHGGEVVEAPKV
jgi:hypothetical protein